MSERQSWPVDTVRLRREGGEDDPLAVAVVSVRVGEQWIDVISELLAGNFDHYAEICNWHRSEQRQTSSPTERGPKETT